MHPFEYRTLIRLVTCTAILLGLFACERDSYTSWNCKTPNQATMPMVLRKAQMEFLGDKLSYCGSLGNQSYFDQICPAKTEQSAVVFTPSSGTLSKSDQTYQCTAL